MLDENYYILIGKELELINTGEIISNIRNGYYDDIIKEGLLKIIPKCVICGDVHKVGNLIRGNSDDYYIVLTEYEVNGVRGEFLKGFSNHNHMKEYCKKVVSRHGYINGSLKAFNITRDCISINTFKTWILYSEYK